MRQTKRVPTLVDEVVDRFADSAVGPEQRVIDAETAQTLRNLVEELPPRQRSLLRALLFTDRSQAYLELAARTGIPVGSIGPTRERALCQLRQLLEGHRPALQAS